MSSLTVRVEKATSDLLIGPDWTMNMEICDCVNSHHWLSKVVVKTVKKRLQNKNPKVQLLALTLLETMMKNCGDYMHLQVSERKILQEMIKIVRKKGDMHVRDKILVLLDSWQQAFGVHMGKYSQYYWAYDELKRSGVEFPQRSVDAVPIFTPPVTHPTRLSIAGNGIPVNSTKALDEEMASDMRSLSLSDIHSIQSVMELLNEMLLAVNPKDREAVKDEVTMDVVTHCRSNQKKLVQMLNSTGDEKLLGQGLALNDSLQNLLAKHDAIASGSPLPADAISSRSKPSVPSTPLTSSLSNKASGLSTRVTTPAKHVSFATRQINEEEDDEFARLANRRSQMSPMSSQGTPAKTTAAGTTAVAATGTCKELALPDPPNPVRTKTKEQDMIDLLSITLCTNSPSPRTTLNPPSTSSSPFTPQEGNQAHASPTAQGCPNGSQNYHVNQGQIVYDSYVVPWAQPQLQYQLQPSQPQPQPLLYTSSYPSSQLSTTASSHYNPSFSSYTYEMCQANHTGQTSPTDPHQMAPANNSLLASRQLQHFYSFGSRGNNAPPSFIGAQTSTNSVHVGPRTLLHYSSCGSGGNVPSAYGEAQVTTSPRHVGPRPLQHYNSFGSKGNDAASAFGSPAGNKPFVPSYRLFEDLIDLKNVDGAMKTNGASIVSLSATSSQGMVGGLK